MDHRRPPKESVAELRLELNFHLLGERPKCILHFALCSLCLCFAFEEPDLESKRSISALDQVARLNCGQISASTHPKRTIAAVFACSRQI